MISTNYKVLFQIFTFIMIMGSGIFFSGYGYSEIKLSGSFRNDSIFSRTTNDVLFNDIFETKLIFKRKASDWKFYADMRIKMFYGNYANQITTLESSMLSFILNSMFITNESIPLTINSSVSINILRAFIKYYSPIGDITLGKTYVNFGNPGVFNPFETTKSITFTDLTYDKEGIPAAELRFSFSDLSGGYVYLSPTDPLTNTSAGISFFANVWTFDLGIVYNRKTYNENVTGIYFKGDLGVGIHGGYAFHIDDFGESYNEANFGLDYSFFDGKLITSLVIYYAEPGAEYESDYKDISTDRDTFFKARYYLYSNIYYIPNEFANFKIDSFFNLIDSSVMLIPSLNFSVANGLNLGVMGIWMSGEGDQEFSNNSREEFSLLLRIEVKL